MTEPVQPQQPTREHGSPLVTVLGFVLYTMAGLPILFGGLIMPGYAVGILGLIWLVGLVLAIRWRRRRGVFFALPLVMVAIWFAVAWLGETLLGWTA